MNDAALPLSILKPFFVGQLQKMSDVPPLPTFCGESDGSDDGSQSYG